MKPAMSRLGCERARALGIDADRVAVPGGFHAVPLLRRGGSLLALPGARRYGEHVAAALERFCT